MPNLGVARILFDPHPRTVMPTTWASSAAPEAGALPIPTESQRSILVENVAGQPGTGRVGLDEIPADGVDLAAHRGSRETALATWHIASSGLETTTTTASGASTNASSDISLFRLAGTSNE